VATEAGVHHGARLLRLQPLEALRLVPLPQAEDAVVAVAAAGAEEGAERADGADALVRAAELGEGVRLQTIERVEDERAGLCALYDLRLVEAEAGVAGVVQLAEEAGEVPERHRRQAGDPVDDGVQVISVYTAAEAGNDKFIVT
jgi:hypothetical protein